MRFKSPRLARGVFLIFNSQFGFLVLGPLRPSVGPPPVAQPPRGGTKARGCKTGHRIVQAAGQGDPLGWRLHALLWSGFGSSWQRVRSHPALSKVSARASRAREHVLPFILSQQPLKWGLFLPPLIVAAGDGAVGKPSRDHSCSRKRLGYETQCLNLWK